MTLPLFPDEPPVFSVSSLTTYIREVFDSDELLQDVWVEGEISNYRPQPSGHWYFTLKDDRSQLGAVMWRTDTANQIVTPENGVKIRARGYVSVYEPRGQYQIYLKEIIPLDKMGDLHAEFRRLWDQLEAEGLFDPAIKRSLPAFPERIGIVTSRSAAAFQDVQNVLQRRYPIAELILSHTPVQGADAAPQIVSALRRIDDYRVDVILIVRGGGSLEDLWCFNDERIARAIRETRSPVVTGVGHETDTTLVDGAADYRAPTPSAAAEVITPDVTELRERLDDLTARLVTVGRDTLAARRGELDDVRHKLRLVSPVSRLRTERQRVDELHARLFRAMTAQLTRRRESLAAQERALKLANPQHLLSRGYAIVSRKLDGKRITRAQDAGPGTTIQVQLADGSLTATVKDRTVDSPPGA